MNRSHHLFDPQKLFLFFSRDACVGILLVIVIIKIFPQGSGTTSFASRIQGISNERQPRSTILFLRQLIKIHIHQPGMLLHIHGTARKGPQTFGRIHRESLTNQIGHITIFRYFARHFEVTLANGFKEQRMIRSIAFKGCRTRKHFVNQNPPRPIITRRIMTSSQNDFGCHIERRSTSGKSLFRHAFGKAQIDNDGISILIQQDIFGF
mmetsp:Transcript_33566/g.69842  ORF Transcript_33566/g.69842 Transcript_33566/m.69842 type:complete len:208 (-) Transcript_33566:759-1382(-)